METVSLGTADLYITEPMTMATDYLLAVFSAGLAVSLLGKAGPGKRSSVLMWVAGFLAAAVAAVAGGTAHGLRLYLGPANHAFVWRLTVISIGLAAFLMLAAGIGSARHPSTAEAARRRAGHGWLKIGILVTLIGLLIQRAHLSLHVHFNHNDLYHLVQMAGMYFFYRGTLLLHDL